MGGRKSHPDFVLDVDGGGQLVLVVKEMVTLVDVGEWNCGFLPLSV